jgi:hypothetical protein
MSLERKEICGLLIFRKTTTKISIESKMTTSISSEKNVFIQEGRSLVEQRSGLNLMINVMSQNAEKGKRSLLDPNIF